MGGNVIRSVAVLAVAVGVGILAWGMSSVTFDEPLRSPFGAYAETLKASEAIGVGAGLLTLGLCTLVVGCARPKPPQAPPRS